MFSKNHKSRGFGGLLNFSNHFIFGLSVFLILYFISGKPFEQLDFIISGTLFIYFSLFPDVDTDSKIQNATYLTLFVIVLILIILNNYFFASMVGLFALVPVMATHRHLTHQWYIALFVCIGIAYILGFYYSLWALGGYIVHLIADRL